MKVGKKEKKTVKKVKKYKWREKSTLEWNFTLKRENPHKGEISH